MPKLNGRPFLLNGVAEGIPARVAYRQWRAEAQRLSEISGENWTAGRLTVFQQQYSSMLRARGQVAEALVAPKDQPGGGIEPVPREATRPGGYLQWAVAFTRMIGSAEVERSFHPIRSRELLTPQQVEDIVRRDIEDSAQQAHGTFEGYTVEAAVWTGTEALIPESEGP